MKIQDMAVPVIDPAQCTMVPSHLHGEAMQLWMELKDPNQISWAASYREMMSFYDFFESRLRAVGLDFNGHPTTLPFTTSVRISRAEFHAQPTTAVFIERVKQAYAEAVIAWKAYLTTPEVAAAQEKYDQREAQIEEATREVREALAA